MWKLEVTDVAGGLKQDFLMRVPILPTLVVAAAIAIMIALGIWQLGRMDEKAALIARAEQALQ